MILELLNYYKISVTGGLRESLLKWIGLLDTIDN